VIGITTRVLYGTGGAVYAVKEAAFSTFVLLFYTQVLGLSGSVTGIVLSAALVWDGLTDPLVGSWSDRLQSKYGRRHPFIALSVVPLGLGFIGLFSPPTDIIENSTLLTGWLLFWTLWIRTFLTTFAIPHLALSGDISNDYQERNKVMGARMIFIFLFSLLLPAVGLLLIFPEEGGIDGRFVVANYPIYGLISCAVVWVMGIIATVGTRQHIISSLPEDSAAVEQPQMSLNTLFSDLFRTLKNKTFRNLLKYEVSAMIAWGTMSALNILAWTYYWEFSATEVSLILALPSLLAIGLVMFTLGPISKRFEKHQQLRASLIVMILDLLWLYPLKLLGVLPEDSPGLDFFLNFIFMVVFIYCYLFRAISSYSIISDISDEHEWNYGVRQEAGFFAVMNFIAKFSLIIGPIYAGIALDVIDLTQGVLPGNVPLATQNGLVYAMGIGVLPALLFAVYFVGRLKLGRAQVEDYQEKLKARSQQPTGA
jgi:GPH family glycoside/pentoside/hexuronide:cation symporter